MKFSEIPKYTSEGSYQADISWDYLPTWILNKSEDSVGCNIDPDYQRGRVWNKDQKRQYIEHCLRGGQGSNIIRWNCAGWMNSYQGKLELVDGKQRLTTVLEFLDDMVEVFGGKVCSDFEDPMRLHNYSFKFIINNLETREEILNWYLEINSGGTPHTPEELKRVQTLLEKEMACHG